MKHSETQIGSARRRRSRIRGQRGFTLVEMLVVITIIGLIMSLVGPRVLNYLGESKIKAAKIQIQSFSSALDLFYLEAGRRPDRVERSLPEGRHRAERPLGQTLCLSLSRRTQRL